MRLISAVLLGAAATLPALVHATTTIAEPADVAAPVPAVTVPSAFEGYQPYQDGDGPTWQQLNRTVMAMPPKGGVKHESPTGKPADNKNSHHSMHGEAAK
ncbi:hypothetical protein LMG22037_05032 [Paraburkholderia phenoliruptrix]|jgi:hypothetical protein|uniref:Uncharacterized protein n=1 Tax=Paraburkholderia phenoliruptrix TaxID=252970 RepID=A0A6J5C174_9BURK|nr:hypothetical protein [Paraburkholderia phenoliruptrix]CAB3724233.1 hypothetical protein LMG22037_05032 [Paraburkholderia phenoliruptrix]